MKTKVRDLGFILSLVLIIIIAIWLGYEKIQTNGIDLYLTKIGQNLLELIPEGKDKEEAADLYADFLGKVKNREIEPEKVEELTAKIINLTYSDSIVDPRQIIKVMEIDTSVQPWPEKEKDFVFVETEPDSEQVRQWERLEKRLQAVITFEESVMERAKKHERIAEKFHFEMTEGLKIKLRRDHIREMKRRENPELRESIENLEKMKMIAWEDMISTDVELEEVLKFEQEALETVKSLPVFKDSLLNLELQIKHSIDSISLEISEQLEDLQ